MTAIDTGRLREVAGLTGDEDEARATPGQQTIDGGEVQSEELPPPELIVNGTAQLGLFEAGGKTPTSASVRLAGGKIGLVDGRCFKKGDRIVFEVAAIVDEVTQKDKADSSTGIVVSCEQKHVARITDLRVIETS